MAALRYALHPEEVSLLLIPGNAGIKSRSPLNIAISMVP